MGRKILVEVEVDWENYDDVIDELIIEDAIEVKAEKVSIKVLNSNTAQDNRQLLDLVDDVWSYAWEGTQIPSTVTAKMLLAKRFNTDLSQE